MCLVVFIIFCKSKEVQDTSKGGVAMTCLLCSLPHLASQLRRHYLIAFFVDTVLRGIRSILHITAGLRVESLLLTLGSAPSSLHTW